MTDRFGGKAYGHARRKQKKVIFPGRVLGVRGRNRQSLRYGRRRPAPLPGPELADPSELA
jgi:hypothetical protein